MKKILIIFLLCILLVGCKSNNEEEISNNNTDNNFSTEGTVNVLSERRNYLDNLIKVELINNGYLIEKKLKSFKVDSISVYGYYKKNPDRKDMQVNFNYECISDKNDCVKNINSGYSGYIIWINTDEKKIYEIKNGLSLSYNDIESGNYVRVNEIIN